MQKSLIVAILMSLFACVSIPDTKFDSLPPGIWRGYLKLYDDDYNKEQLVDEKTEAIYKELPFNFEISYVNDSVKFLLINGSEKLDIAEVTIGLDRATAKDTVTIDFPIFNTYLKGLYEDGVLEGRWHVRYKDNYSIPFIAFHGQTHRFSNSKSKTVHKLDGRWKTTFEFDKEDDQYMAVGEFYQNDNELTGTFRTETGDYRYLEGNIIKDKLFLSTFDGAHAFLFEALVRDEEMIGIFKSGKHYTSNWIANKDENFELGEPSGLTKATNSDKPVDFSFIDLSGNIVKLTDEQYSGKNKILNIMGTWCPNCFDEIQFLQSKSNMLNKLEFEIISIAFERFKNESKSLEALSKYKDQMNIAWDVLYGGFANKEANQKQLGFIDKLLSYPTLVVLDKNNMIKYIHTGFAGPATSKYQDFTKEFDKVIKQISKE